MRSGLSSSLWLAVKVFYCGEWVAQWTLPASLPAWEKGYQDGSSQQLWPFIPCTFLFGKEEERVAHQEKRRAHSWLSAQGSLMVRMHGTICGARNWTLVSQVQSKHPTCCTVSQAHPPCLASHQCASVGSYFGMLVFGVTPLTPSSLSYFLIVVYGPELGIIFWIHMRDPVFGSFFFWGGGLFLQSKRQVL